MSKCTHTYPDGFSAISFPRKVKWRGIYPGKVKGRCAICGETIEISDREYKKFQKGGDAIGIDFE